MLKENIQNHIQAGRPLLALEKELADKYLLNTNTVEDSDESRFRDAYVELVHKETEATVRNVTAEEILTQPITYLKMNKEHFIYIDSSWFDIIGIDGMSLEVDDLFGTYEVLFGLKRKKKEKQGIVDYFNEHLGEQPKHSILFSGQEGIWEINFAANGLVAFQETMTLDDLLQNVYQFLFQLNIELDEGKTMVE
ncbi:branched-chain amino acid aminotransferase [Bacillus spongiae]|uniref:Branched-chain amino acid aminotransferase n=1 Tax=Bacillus spongiae TaxID=2683610 RepID=A0ABU8HCT8_9BACI